MLVLAVTFTYFGSSHEYTQIVIIIRKMIMIIIVVLYLALDFAAGSVSLVWPTGA